MSRSDRAVLAPRGLAQVECLEECGKLYDRYVVDCKRLADAGILYRDKVESIGMDAQLPSRTPTIEDVLGPLAAAIMRVVWAEGESTVASVVAALGERRSRAPAYTTVMTVMGRLNERQLLSRVKRGRQYVYRATDREEGMIEGLGRHAIDDVVSRFGSTAYRQFALRLAEIDPDLRARLVKLAATHEEA